MHLSYAGVMLGQRRKRWPNIKPGWDECDNVSDITAENLVLTW